MTYNKTTWQSGDTITAEKLNNIESGIESASKQVTITRIINNSGCDIACSTSGVVLIDDVLCRSSELDKGYIMIPSNSTSDVITLPGADTQLVGFMIWNLDSLAVLTSDTLDSYYDDWSWECGTSEPLIPDNLSITISDPPLGEERTIPLQHSWVGGVPDTITGHVNEWVHIDHVSSGNWAVSAYAFYDAATQNGVELFISALGDTYEDLTISFRIPSTDVVSDTGHIQINGSR